MIAVLYVRFDFFFPCKFVVIKAEYKEIVVTYSLIVECYFLFLVL